MAAVGWQAAFGTEFDEEWPDDLHVDASNDRDGHLEAAVEMEPMVDIMRSRAANDHSYLAVGTFVVHDDEPLTPMQPKAQKAFRKDIFTPLKLETMFNPPSPQETRVPTPEQSLYSSNSKRIDATPDRSVPFFFNGVDSGNAFPFTFSVQRSLLCPDPVQPNCTNPQVDKSRLRLFQFHYDTFTREHLSALVDAIPVSSSSLSASSASIHDGTDSPSMLSHYRPAKRIKLSPPDHLPRTRRRHRLSLPRNAPMGGRKDNIRESRSLVQTIADARSFSSPLARTPPPANNPLEREGNVKGVGEDIGLEAQEKLEDLKQGGYSSLGFKRQAADLMAQIRSDTWRSISPMSITAEISALSIGTDLHLRRKLALREDRVSSGPGFSLPRKMVWTKETDQELNRNANIRETSDDPFWDFESLVDGDSDRVLSPKLRSEADGEVLPRPDSEDSTLSATQDHDSQEKRNVQDTPGFTGHIADDGPQPDGGTTQDLPERQSSASPPPANDWTIDLIKNVTADHHRTPSVLSSNPAKRPLPAPLRSALKLGTPTSSESTPHPPLVNRTAGVAPRRSVSFSDGRTNGRIRGLHDSQTDGSQSPQSLRSFSDISMPMQVQQIPANDPGELFETSARADRIAEMLECLEGDSVDSSKASPIRPATNPMPVQVQPRSRRGSSVAPSANTTTRTHVNATFLTECSFGIAHDRLVQCITDAQTFEPHWENLLSIDLSGKQLDSVARLKEFLPSLDTLKLDDNALPWLSGIPNTVHVLSVVRNRLTSLTSYTHLSKLEVLDISHNEIDSLIQLECLRRLRELRADYNVIRDFTGLKKLENLKKLSLTHNKIEEVDLECCRWTRLEHLNLSANSLSSLLHVANAEKLCSLTLDNNFLCSLQIEKPMPYLRSLRLSDNRLTQLDVGHLRALKTLYADRNRLTSLIRAERLEKLETLSLRQQSGKGLSLLSRDVRDVRRLYLSGNSLAEWFLTEPCYNLVYLEVARCQIRQLPANLAVLIPNVRTLNLNFNFISDVQPLQGLVRLRKLSLVGSHMQGTKSLIKAVRKMTELELVDFRMNPCTLSWYMPIIDPGSGFTPDQLIMGNGEKGGAPQVQAKSQVQAVEEEAKEAQAMDAKFRRGLPDDLYVGRLVYRGLLATSCGQKLCMVDGVKLTQLERDKAAALLRNLEGRVKSPKANAHSAEDEVVSHDT